MLENPSFDEEKKHLVNYLLHCVRKNDWHGTSDAANDLRVFEAENTVKHHKITYTPGAIQRYDDETQEQH